MYKLKCVMFLAMVTSVVINPVFSENRVKHLKLHKRIMRDIVKNGECSEGFIIVSNICVPSELYTELKVDYDDEVLTWSQAGHVTSQPGKAPGRRRHYARTRPHPRPVWHPRRTPNVQMRPSLRVKRPQKTLHSKSTLPSKATPGPTLTPLPVSRAEKTRLPLSITTTTLFVLCVSLLVHR